MSGTCPVIYNCPFKHMYGIKIQERVVKCKQVTIRFNIILYGETGSDRAHSVIVDNIPWAFHPALSFLSPLKER